MKQRVPKGEKYWSIRILEGIIVPSGYTETNTQVDSCNFNSGNYFRTEEEAEQIARKLQAVLNDTDVIEKVWDYIFINFLSEQSSTEQEWWKEDFTEFIKNI